MRLQESNTSQSNETRRGRRTYGAQLLYLAVLLAAAQMVHAQSSILGTNLIVNGNAEAGPAGTGVNDIVTSIPGWTRAGNINVLSYGLTGLVLLTDPAPPPITVFNTSLPRAARKSPPHSRRQLMSHPALLLSAAET